MEEEIELSEEDKILIKELLAKKLLLAKGEKNQILLNEALENKIFNNEKYFRKTGKLCKEDRMKIIKLLLQDLITNTHDCSISDQIPPSENNISLHDAEVESTLLNIVENIKSPNINAEQKCDESRSISKEDRYRIWDILNYFNKEVVNEDGYNICDMPTRPNSKHNSPKRVSIPAEKKSITAGIMEEHNKNKLNIEGNVHDERGETLLENYCNDMIVNIKNTNINVTSHNVKNILSNNEDSIHQFGDAKNKFLKFFVKQDELSVDVKDNQSKEYCTTGEKAFHLDEETSKYYSCKNNQSYHYKTHQVSNTILNKFIIEEKSFSFSMDKIPMDDTGGPYYIDKDKVNVDIYQTGLVDRWYPTQVVHELCSQCQWQPPSFVQHDYSLGEGFHFGVSVKDYHFVPKNRGQNKKLAKHYASTFFLHFLGFKFMFNNNEPLILSSTSLYSNYDNKKKFTTTQIHTNERLLTSRGFTDTRTEVVLSSENHISKHKTHYPNTSVNVKAIESQYNLPGGSMMGHDNQPRGTRSIFTRVMQEVIREQQSSTAKKRDRSGSNSSYESSSNEEYHTRKGKRRKSRREMKNHDRSSPNVMYGIDNTQEKKLKKRHIKEEMKNRDRSSSYSRYLSGFKHSMKEYKMKERGRLGSNSSSETSYNSEEYAKKHEKRKTRKEMLKHVRSSSNSTPKKHLNIKNYVEEKKYKRNIEEDDRISSDMSFNSEEFEKKHKKRKTSKEMLKHVRSSSNSTYKKHFNITNYTEEKKYKRNNEEDDRISSDTSFNSEGYAKKHKKRKTSKEMLKHERSSSNSTDIKHFNTKNDAEEKKNKRNNEEDDRISSDTSFNSEEYTKKHKKRKTFKEMLKNERTSSNSTDKKHFNTKNDAEEKKYKRNNKEDDRISLDTSFNSEEYPKKHKKRKTSKEMLKRVRPSSSSTYKKHFNYAEEKKYKRNNEEDDRISSSGSSYEMEFLKEKWEKNITKS